MSALLDTSVLIASLDPDEPHHTACDTLLAAGGHYVFAHGLAETFAILTGGRRTRRLRASDAANLIDEAVSPYVQLVHLTGRETLAALADAERRGARGGAIYDLLHLCAARKAGVATLATLDVRDFEALARPGDPRIEAP